MLTPAVTGGLGGIGAALTQTLLLSGADVAVTDMQQDADDGIWRKHRRRPTHGPPSLTSRRLRSRDRQTSGSQAIIYPMRRDE